MDEEGPIFVIQEHDASRLHWDFRLEIEGALASWACPHEVPLEPGRIVGFRVNDHALTYATFEGTIPEGHYGAGTVKTWDLGTFNFIPSRGYPDVKTALHKGKLKFNLKGVRCQGTYALIRLPQQQGRQESWFLIKTKDDIED